MSARAAYRIVTLVTFVKGQIAKSSLNQDLQQEFRQGEQLNSRGPKSRTPGDTGGSVTPMTQISGKADRDPVGAARGAGLADPVGVLAGPLGMVSPPAIVLDRSAERRVAVHDHRFACGAGPSEHVVANPVLYRRRHPDGKSTHPRQ